jgi:hypothetical protein
VGDVCGLNTNVIKEVLKDVFPHRASWAVVLTDLRVDIVPQCAAAALKKSAERVEVLIKLFAIPTTIGGSHTSDAWPAIVLVDTLTAESFNFSVTSPRAEPRGCHKNF